ncbi:universal stress protein [Aequorivita capsosiphonis]|uniref:universal stress protein n=1 Tax=Aequorivita capsosiphonis TaxID=487317 RepID=UPI00047CD7FF|nr:universal stress protein [Aequorivita capsosiphonis]
MKNILLPTDFSENSKNAIKYAIKIYEGETCTFHILNSQKPSNYITADVVSRASGVSVYEGVLDDNKVKLDEMVQFCKSISEGEDFSFKPKLDFDNIVDAVNQVIASNNIEVIVMGTNGATNASEVLFGSNTLKIIRNASCPIIAVPEGYIYQKIASVLLSLNYQYDITGENFKILLNLLKKKNASLKILAIEEEKIHLADQRKQAEEFFKETNFETFTIKNLPAPMAINAFEQLIPIQLHAMVVERKSFLNRFIFGSHTSEISYGSQVPLLVIRE